MPSVNIYTNRDRIKPLESILPELRKFIAKEVSCGGRLLVPNDISLRVLVPDASLQIADTELEIKAHSYDERVKKQVSPLSQSRDYNCQNHGNNIPNHDLCMQNNLKLSLILRLKY